jgi:hypothetical protein
LNGHTHVLLIWIDLWTLIVIVEQEVHMLWHGTACHMQATNWKYCHHPFPLLLYCLLFWDSVQTKTIAISAGLN